MAFEVLHGYDNEKTTDDMIVCVCGETFTGPDKKEKEREHFLQQLLEMALGMGKK